MSINKIAPFFNRVVARLVRLKRGNGGVLSGKIDSYCTRYHLLWYSAFSLLSLTSFTFFTFYPFGLLSPSSLSFFLIGSPTRFLSCLQFSSYFSFVFFFFFLFFFFFRFFFFLLFFIPLLSATLFIYSLFLHSQRFLPIQKRTTTIFFLFFKVDDRQ